MRSLRPIRPSHRPCLASLKDERCQLHGRVCRDLRLHKRFLVLGEDCMLHGLRFPARPTVLTSVELQPLEQNNNEGNR